MKPWLEDSYWRRQRLICVTEGGANVELAAALSYLEALHGVIAAENKNGKIYVEYDLRDIDLQTIRATITNRKLSIEENRWQRFMRWITEHKEAVRREEQHVDFGWDAVIQAAYANRYRMRRHGRRDDRLTNWRQYEAANRKNNPLNHGQ